MKFAVLVETSRYVPSDGHGYPAHHENFTQFVPFTTQQELLKWVELSRGKKYTAIQYEELEIVTEIKCKTKPVYRSSAEIDADNYANRKDFS